MIASVASMLLASCFKRLKVLTGQAFDGTWFIVTKGADFNFIMAFARSGGRGQDVYTSIDEPTHSLYSHRAL